MKINKYKKVIGHVSWNLEGAPKPSKLSLKSQLFFTIIGLPFFFFYLTFFLFSKLLKIKM
jgi:hypothetical protein